MGHAKITKILKDKGYRKQNGDLFDTSSVNYMINH